MKTAANKGIINKNLGLVFWFIFPIILLNLFYNPFEQPLFFDRSYLLYMSQVVSRGEFVYKQTTFGYTPISVLIIGYLMKFGNLFSLTTIESARIFGIFFYGCITSAFYCLVRSLWSNTWAVTIACLLFTGLDYLALLSCINAEPKLWVLWLSIIGLWCFHKHRWFWCGSSFALASMCWHFAVVSLFACAFSLLLLRKDIINRFVRLLAGVLVGTLPLIIYLFATSQWLEFWQQAILRKINMEGEVVGESPFHWLLQGIYPWFLTESFHFVLGAIGFFILAFVVFSKKVLQPTFTSQHSSVLFLVVYTLFWSMANSLEFQSNIDMLPLIPVIVIFTGYVIVLLLQNKRKFAWQIGLVILIIYNYYNGITYKIAYRYSQQYETFKKLDEQYGNALAIGCSSYYVALEKPAPTKYVNFLPYEESFIQDKVNCAAVKDSLKKHQISYIIEVNRPLLERSPHAQNVADLFGRSVVLQQHARSQCAKTLLNSKQFVDQDPHVELKIQTILISNFFYTKEKYFIYQIE